MARNRQDLRRGTTGVRTVRAEAQGRYRRPWRWLGGCRWKWWNRWKEGSKERKQGTRERTAGPESVGDSCRGVAGSISVDRRHKLFQWTQSSGSIVARSFSSRRLSRLTRTCRSIRGILARARGSILCRRSSCRLSSLSSFRFILTATVSLARLTFRYLQTNIVLLFIHVLRLIKILVIFLKNYKILCIISYDMDEIFFYCLALLLSNLKIFRIKYTIII